MDDRSAELLARYSAGDQAAADEIFARYLERLTSLVRSRLSPKLAARLDPEDVVLSAYRSFFLAARQDRFSVERSGDLWRLLVSITLHKLYRTAKRQTAARRAVQAEVPLGAWIDIDQLVPARAPTPDEALALADEVEAVMSQLDPASRRVLELRLQGEPLAEIATDVQCSERTVRRKLAEIERFLADRARDQRDG